MRMTVEQELELAHNIRASEQRARDAVAGIELVESILSERSARTERTRASAVDRLIRAVEMLAQVPERDEEDEALPQRSRGCSAPGGAAAMASRYVSS